MYEVLARYALNAPTLWAHDVSRFLTATTFLLAAAWCQYTNSNIRVDVFAAHMSNRRRASVEAVYLAVLLLPALTVICHASVVRAVSAFTTGEVDPVSPWAPRVWPFYAALALALISLWIQCAMSLVDSILSAMGRVEDGIVTPDNDKVESI